MLEFYSKERSDCVPPFIQLIREELAAARWSTSLERRDGKGIVQNFKASPQEVKLPFITCSLEVALQDLLRRQPFLARLLASLTSNPFLYRQLNTKSLDKSRPPTPTPTQGRPPLYASTVSVSEEALAQRVCANNLQVLLSAMVIGAHWGDTRSAVQEMQLSLGVLLVSAGTSATTRQVLHGMGFCANVRLVAEFLTVMIEKKKKMLEGVKIKVMENKIVVLIDDNFVPKAEHKGSLARANGSIVTYIPTISRIEFSTPWTDDLQRQFGDLLKVGVKVNKTNIPFTRATEFFAANDVKSSQRTVTQQSHTVGFDKSLWLVDSTVPPASLFDYVHLPSWYGNFGKFDDWRACKLDSVNSYIGVTTVTINVGDLANSEFWGAYQNRPWQRVGAEGAFDRMANMPDQFHLQMKNIMGIITSKHFIQVWCLIGGKSFHEKKAQPIIDKVQQEVDNRKRARTGQTDAEAGEGQTDAEAGDASPLSIIPLLDEIDEDGESAPFGDSFSGSAIDELDATGAAIALSVMHLELDCTYQGDFVGASRKDPKQFDRDLDDLSKALAVANILLVPADLLLAPKVMLLRMQNARSKATTDEEEDNDVEMVDNSAESVDTAAVLSAAAPTDPMALDDDRVETQGMSSSEAALFLQCYGRVLLQFLIVGMTYKTTSRKKMFTLARTFLEEKCEFSKDVLAGWSDDVVVEKISAHPEIGETFRYVFEFLEVDVVNSTEPFLQSTDGKMGPVMGNLTYLYYNAVFLGHFKVANNVLDFIENYLRWQVECPNIIRWMSLNWRHVNGFFVEHFNAMIRIGVRGNLSFEAIQRESLLVELKHRTREGFRDGVGLKKGWRRLPELQRRAEEVKGEKYSKEREIVARNLEELFVTVFAGTYKHEYRDRKYLVFNSKLKKMPSGRSKGGETVGFEEMKRAWAATLTQEKKKSPRGPDDLASMKVDELLKLVRDELPSDKVPKKGKGTGKNGNVVKADLVAALLAYRLERELELDRNSAEEVRRLSAPQNYTRQTAKKKRGEETAST